MFKKTLAIFSVATIAILGFTGCSQTNSVERIPSIYETSNALGRTACEEFVRGQVNADDSSVLALGVAVADDFQEAWKIDPDKWHDANEGAGILVYQKFYGDPNSVTDLDLINKGKAMILSTCSKAIN